MRGGLAPQPCAARQPPHAPAGCNRATVREQVLSWKGWRGPAYPNHWREARGGPLAPLSRMGRQLQQGLRTLTGRLQPPQWGRPPQPEPDGREFEVDETHEIAAANP